MASTLAVRLTAAKLAPPTEAHRSAQQTRDQIHEAIRTRDLEPYLLLIDPLLEEHSAAEVAAAATALDGYPLACKGEGGRAIGLTTTASAYWRYLPLVFR